MHGWSTLGVFFVSCQQTLRIKRTISTSLKDFIPHEELIYLHSWNVFSHYFAVSHGRSRTQHGLRGLIKRMVSASYNPIRKHSLVSVKTFGAPRKVMGFILFQSVWENAVPGSFCHGPK